MWPGGSERRRISVVSASTLAFDDDRFRPFADPTLALLLVRFRGSIVVCGWRDERHPWAAPRFTSSPL